MINNDNQVTIPTEVDLIREASPKAVSDNPPLPEKRNEAITADSVVRFLVEHIIQNNLKENDRLPSLLAVAEALGTNRSIVRTGYLRAETLGIITTHPRAGAFVRRFDFDQLTTMFALLFELGMSQLTPRVLHIYDVRTVLEREAFRAAALRASPEDLHVLHEWLTRIEAADTRAGFIDADERFHLAVATISGNQILVTMLKSIFTMLRAHRVSAQLESPAYEQVLADHRALYGAIVDHDAERAVELAFHHSDRRRQEILQEIMST